MPVAILADQGSQMSLSRLLFSASSRRYPLPINRDRLRIDPMPESTPTLVGATRCRPHSHRHMVHAAVRSAKSSDRVRQRRTGPEVTYLPVSFRSSDTDYAVAEWAVVTSSLSPPQPRSFHLQPHEADSGADCCHNHLAALSCGCPVGLMEGSHDGALTKTWRRSTRLVTAFSGLAGCEASTPVALQVLGASARAHRS